MKRTIVILFAATVAFTTACDSPKTATTSEGSTEEHHEHGAEGATPGSHADWCGEHQVPESMCTRCNGSLIAGFKATGDWCEEHELPKSQCVACNPDLVIERPPEKAAP